MKGKVKKSQERGLKCCMPFMLGINQSFHVMEYSSHFVQEIVMCAILIVVIIIIHNTKIT